MLKLVLVIGWLRVGVARAVISVGVACCLCACAARIYNLRCFSLLVTMRQVGSRVVRIYKRVSVLDFVPVYGVKWWFTHARD